jgi:SAM-dependent methyltransferase
MVELWNETGASYDNRWQSTASKALSAMELDYIHRYCERSPGGTVLDIGVGTGRILECLVKQDNTDNVYGIDLSEEMARHCRNGVKSGKLKEIEVLDVSVEDIPFDVQFDFMTAVRVLPYCENWEEVLSRVIARLKPGGILVFSMPNRRSINRFTPCPVPIEWATRGQIEQLALNNGVELLAIESLTRLPDVFYHVARGGFSAKALLAVEGWLRKILGKTLLGRFLFVAVRKPAGGSAL